MSRDVAGQRDRSVLNTLLLLMVFAFSCLRFVHLGADFPLGLTTSGVLYTDEGWYANAAIRHYLFGNGYLAGDYNPAINMPLGQILHRLVFEVFGLHLTSVRITTTVCYLLMGIIATWFVRRRFNRAAAALTAVLLATSFAGFAYSRLATMEFVATFFTLSGLLVAEHGGSEGRLTRVLLASLLISAGILTKTTMVFAAPLLALLAWRHGRSGGERALFLSVAALVVLCVVGAHQVAARTLFPEDYAYFNHINVQVRLHPNVGAWLLDLPRVVMKIGNLGAAFVVFAAIATGAALVASPGYRRHDLVRLLVAYVVLYMATLSVVSYGTPWYYLPLLAPLAILAATSCIELEQWLGRTRAARMAVVPLAPILIATAIALAGGGRIAAYLAQPKYSFAEMAHGVGDILREREGDVSQVVLFGQIADSVALETGVRAVSTRLGTHPLRWKVQEYHPAYLLLHIDEEVVRAVEAAGGRVTELAAWDVYGNYYGDGQRVRLWHVRWDQGAADAGSQIVASNVK